LYTKSANGEIAGDDGVGRAAIMSKYNTGEYKVPYGAETGVNLENPVYRSKFINPAYGQSPYAAPSPTVGVTGAKPQTVAGSTMAKAQQAYPRKKTVLG